MLWSFCCTLCSTLDRPTPLGSAGLILLDDTVVCSSSLSLFLSTVYLWTRDAPVRCLSLTYFQSNASLVLSLWVLGFLSFPDRLIDRCYPLDSYRLSFWLIRLRHALWLLCMLLFAHFVVRSSVKALDITRGRFWFVVNVFLSYILYIFFYIYCMTHGYLLIFFAFTVLFVEMKKIACVCECFEYDRYSCRDSWLAIQLCYLMRTYCQRRIDSTCCCCSTLCIKKPHVYC